jgi:pyoverdine/dityrosine biosynthesis protein Dit1
MKLQEYLQSKLDDLLQPAGLPKPADDELAEAIVKLMLSKKFRKYSVSPEQLAHIKSSVEDSLNKNEPIKFTLPFGSYKLWRLAEQPEADWAELFTMMYFTKWLKPICEIYEPGVWFDFFSDEVIVPKMNNIPERDVKAYEESFKRVLGFIKPYQPANLNMTLTRVRDQYDNDEAFEADLEQQIINLKSELDGGLPALNDAQRATVELNVKTTSEQATDPQWREKV